MCAVLDQFDILTVRVRHSVTQSTANKGFSQLQMYHVGVVSSVCIFK